MSPGATDGGQTWTATLVFHAPLNTALNNVFPSLAVNPTNGNLYAVWSDAHSVFFSSSSDEGSTWSPAVAVSIAPANTALFPWVTNHVGVICTGGTSCQAGTRNLLDLFQVAINPQNGKAAIIYTDDTLTTDSSGNPLPQVVLAQQK